MRTIQNILEDETIKDMVGSMGRIYAVLEKKQGEYQFLTIEAEGKIDNHPIKNLIDYEASHSYINDNIVEIFHFQRSKHKKTWLV